MLLTLLTLLPLADSCSPHSPTHAVTYGRLILRCSGWLKDGGMFMAVSHTTIDSRELCILSHTS